MERKQKLFRTVMCVCLAVLLAAPVLMGAKYFVRKVLIGRLGLESPVLAWFGGVNTVKNDSETAVADGALLPELTGKVFALEDKIGDAVYANLPLGTKAAELTNEAEYRLGLTLADPSDENAGEDIGDGYLVNRATRKDSSNLYPLLETLRDSGVPTLYVTMPMKLCKIDDAGYDGVVNCTNLMLDARIEKLNGLGIENFDLRAAFHAAGCDHHSLFFKTDHHWKPETACAAGGMIAKELNERFGFSITADAFDLTNYTEERYEKLFLGSIGKKLTLARCEPEDISLWVPKFETSFEVKIASAGMDETGTAEVLFDRRALERGDYYEMSPYSAYLWANRDLIEVTNLGCPDGLRLLFIGDSFDNAMNCFFANAVAELDAVDIRLWKTQAAFNDWLAAHAKDYDAVVVSGGSFTAGTLER